MRPKPGSAHSRSMSASDVGAGRSTGANTPPEGPSSASSPWFSVASAICPLLAGKSRAVGAAGSRRKPTEPGARLDDMVRDGRRALAVPLLVAVTAVWGSTFVIVKDAVARMPVMGFLAWRFALATLIMAVVRPRAVLSLGRRGWWRGFLLGLSLAGGYVAQTYGLRYTSAAASGFITGMFVVFTPLISGVVLRRRIPWAAWAGVALATAGLAVISLHGLHVGFGELL